MFNTRQSSVLFSSTFLGTKATRGGEVFTVENIEFMTTSHHLKLYRTVRSLSRSCTVSVPRDTYHMPAIAAVFPPPLFLASPAAQRCGELGEPCVMLNPMYVGFQYLL